MAFEHLQDMVCSIFDEKIAIEIDVNIVLNSNLHFTMCHITITYCI